MAIYHLSAQLIKRSVGQSSTAAAAYRAGARIADERTGELHDYTKRHGVSYSAILAPSGVPDWVHCRADLWNEVERIEKRKDAQVAREVEIALPRELSFEQMQGLISAFIKKEFVSRGMVADLNIHDADSHNPHAHILLTTRTINESGFGKKERAWNDVELLEGWRESWADLANKALRLSGSSAKIDHRSYKEQGVELTPQIHLGKKNIQKMNKGESNPRIKRFQSIESSNQLALVRAEINEMPDSVFVELDSFNSNLISDGLLTRNEINRVIKHSEIKLAAAETKLNSLSRDYNNAQERMVELSSVINKFPSRKDVRNINAVKEFKCKEDELGKISRSILGVKSFISEIRERITKLVNERNYIVSGIRMIEEQQAQIRPRLQRIFGAVPPAPAQAQPRPHRAKHQRPDEPGL